MKIAINGFGRIGKILSRQLIAHPHPDLELVAINIGKGSFDDVAYFFKYDTVYGTFPGDIRVENAHLIVNNTRIALLASYERSSLTWHLHNVDWVVECTGAATTHELASEHRHAGAKKVLISAPAKGEDITIIPGINHTDYNNDTHHIVSLGSCTSNALLPLLEIIDRTYTIEHAVATTIHAYTNSQRLLDSTDSQKDIRASRAAPDNIIPSTTGAAKVVQKILPRLAGRVHAISVRVPCPYVSFLEIHLQVSQLIVGGALGLHTILQDASDNHYKGIIGITHNQIVSADCKGMTYSALVDASLTYANSTQCSIYAWYDNEWGYVSRLVDFLHYVKSEQ